MQVELRNVKGTNGVVIVAVCRLTLKGFNILQQSDVIFAQSKWKDSPIETNLGRRHLGLSLTN